MSGLLGNKPSRQFKIFRTEFPAIFRFNGKLYQENYNIDTMEDSWIEISEDEATRWLEAKAPESKREGDIEMVQMAGVGETPRACVDALERFDFVWPGATFPVARAAVSKLVLDEAKRIGYVR